MGAGSIQPGFQRAQLRPLSESDCAEQPARTPEETEVIKSLNRPVVGLATTIGLLVHDAMVNKNDPGCVSSSTLHDLLGNPHDRQREFQDRELQGKLPGG